MKLDYFFLQEFKPIDTYLVAINFKNAKINLLFSFHLFLESRGFALRILLLPQLSIYLCWPSMLSEESRFPSMLTRISYLPPVNH